MLVERDASRRRPAQPPEAAERPLGRADGRARDGAAGAGRGSRDPRIVVGGNERAFAAGADIAELAAGTPISLYESRRIDAWDSIRALRTPLVAAVSGFCLGGGCELAMLCDLIVASETARFGQPEINLGVLPGRAARSA